MSSDPSKALGRTPWGPAATLADWRRRQDLVNEIRSFFLLRGVLEVETPALSCAMGTDPHIDYMETRSFIDGFMPDAGTSLYLCTSPEFHMKRLLAAGWGDIWQMCKAFRSGERGERHNPEFSILEWYRVGWDWRRLMDEVVLLCAALGTCSTKWGETSSIPLACRPAHWVTWREAYLRHCGVDPFAATVKDLRSACIRLGLVTLADEESDRDAWLDYLMVSAIEPHLGKEGPEFLVYYPARQAALAVTEPDENGELVARRFELYLSGVELCNGYQELVDGREQERRFQVDQEIRRRLGKRNPPQDQRFLAALSHGLPRCSGVALGLDRLFALLLHKGSIDAVLAFPIERA